MIVAVLTDVDDHPVDRTRELVAMGAVFRRRGRPGVRPDVAGFVSREGHWLGLLHAPTANGLPVIVESDGAALAEAVAVVAELHPHLVIARGDRFIGGHKVVLDAEE